MIGAQNFKLVSVTPPQAIVDNASWTTAEIDTAGYDFLSIVAYLGATDIAMAALKVTESDTSGSGHADISGLDTDGDTDTDGATATLPTATDDNGFVLFEVDLRGRKRYIDVTATAGDGTTGTFLTVLAMLSRGDQTPVTAAERGALNIMRV